MNSVLFALLTLLFPIFISQENVADALRLIEAKDFDGARKILESLVARNDAGAEAHFRLGLLLVNQYREMDAAEEQLEKAVELADNKAEYHFSLGNLYGIQAQNANVFSKMSYAGKVKREFLRAVELAPDHVGYRSALMSYYLMAPGIAGGSVSKAQEQASAILGLDPFEGHMALAEVAAYEKETEKAEQEYKNAIKAKPSQWRPYHRLGYLYLSMKKPDEAITQFKEYVRVAPADANSYDSLGDGYSARGNTDDALANYLKALTVNSKFPSSLFGAARCYEQKGSKEEALQYYRKFLATDPRGSNVETAKQKVEELAGH